MIRKIGISLPRMTLKFPSTPSRRLPHIKVPITERKGELFLSNDDIFHFRNTLLGDSIIPDYAATERKQIMPTKKESKKKDEKFYTVEALAAFFQGAKKDTVTLSLSQVCLIILLGLVLQIQDQGRRLRRYNRNFQEIFRVQIA